MSKNRGICLATGLCALLNISVTAWAQADLSALIHCPASAQPGQELGKDIAVKVRNAGRAAAEDFALDLVISSDASIPVKFAVVSTTFKEDALLKGGREHVKSLPSGRTMGVTLNGTNTIPADTPPGVYFIGAVVDPGNVVRESNEKNNVATCRIRIGEAAGASGSTVKKPDLGVYGFLEIGKHKRQVKWNESITLTPDDATLVSGGKPAFEVYYSYREYDGVAASGFKNKLLFNGKVVSTQTNRNLTPSQVDPVHTQAYLGPENGRLQLKIDADNEVDENREDNNFDFFVTLRFTGFDGRPSAGEATGLQIPRQLSPADNSHFTNFPRKVTLRWKAVSGASAYDVEVDCLHCRQSGKWDSETGPAWKVGNGVRGTSYDFTFVGDNQGRWRVRAVKGAEKSDWSPWWGFSFSTKPGDAADTGNKLPDLIVSNVRLVKGCEIEVTLKNVGAAGVPAANYNLPDAVGVQMHRNGKPWGGIILSGFDTGGNLKSPGGSASWIWFPQAENLKLKPGSHSLKVVVDNNKKLTESDESNNELTRRVVCR
ncbi:MAG: hypothetical protein JXO72_04425 [Vicinamibacteria bacterium]|nr:hypothetical protein [Vicinamibacteria bacterium]